MDEKDAIARRRSHMVFVSTRVLLFLAPTSMRWWCCC